MLCEWYWKGKEKALILPDVIFSGGMYALRLTKLKENEIILDDCPNLEQIKLF